jgi:hypothetical protein
VVFRGVARFIYRIHVTFDFVNVDLPVKHVLDLLYRFDVLLGNEAFNRTSEFSLGFRFAFLDYFDVGVPIIHLIKAEVMLLLSEELFWVLVVACKVQNYNLLARTPICDRIAHFTVFLQSYFSLVLVVSLVLVDHQQGGSLLNPVLDRVHL